MCWKSLSFLPKFLSNWSSAYASFQACLRKRSWILWLPCHSPWLPPRFPLYVCLLPRPPKQSGVACKRPFAQEARQWRLHFQCERETGWGMWLHMIYVGTQLSPSRRRGQSWVSWGWVNTIKLSTWRIRNDVTSVRRQSGTYFKPFHDSKERRTLVASTA